MNNDASIWERDRGSPSHCARSGPCLRRAARPPSGARFELNARRAFQPKRLEAREGDGEIAVGRMDALGEAEAVLDCHTRPLRQ